jgi:hypothetical protein
MAEGLSNQAIGQRLFLSERSWSLTGAGRGSGPASAAAAASTAATAAAAATAAGVAAPTAAKAATTAVTGAIAVSAATRTHHRTERDSDADHADQPQHGIRVAHETPRHSSRSITVTSAGKVAARLCRKSAQGCQQLS